MIKLSDYVVKFIADLGVKHVFMLTGGFAMHLNDSIGRCKDIEFISNLHEQASSIAAEAYSRITNNIGVAIVTAGPGGTNAITGVSAAWLDSTPCLFLSGQVKRADLKAELGVRQLGIQEIDIISLVRNITKYAVTIDDPTSIKYHLEKALYLAKTGRPGPVWIDMPLDVQASMIDTDNLKGFEPKFSLDINKVSNYAEKTIELLNQAKRPVILAGNGIRISGAQNLFLEMIKTLKIPVLTTRLGVDLISLSDELCFGMVGSIAPRGANFALQNSDFLLVLGARLDMALIAYAPEKLARAAKKVMVNIDETEIKKLSSIIDISACCDVKAFINEMLKQFGNIKLNDISDWIDICKNWKLKYPYVLPEYYNQDGISVYVFSDILSEELNSDDIILPGNAGVASELFLTAFKVKLGQRVFHNKGTGAMGFSQPAAIGACLASGRKRTVCIDGDGGFQMNIQELETIKRLNLPIKFFVMNNNGYASIRTSQLNFFSRLTGADESSGLTLPDITSIASAYGLKTKKIFNKENLREQIKEVLNIEGPVVCDVKIIPDEPRMPRVSSMQKPDGSMVSKPLEDMWPFLDRKEFLSNMLIEPVDLMI